MCNIARAGTISIFQGREYQAFYWKIDQFSVLSGKAAENNFYNSSSFNNRYFNGESWLRFYPNGARKISGFIGLCFRSPNYKESGCIHLVLGLKTQSGRIEKWFSGYISFPEKNEFDYLALTGQSEFLKRKEELVPSDCLTLVAILSPNPVEVIRDVGDGTETVEEEKKDEEKEGAEKVIGDIAKLWTSGDKSDTTIIVEEAEYKVHSLILSARTPVFAALFEHNTIEKETKKITITDFEPDIFKEFLNYIYTGSVQNLTAENCLGLYRVADKYLVKDLKEMCREYIKDSLCSEMFCDVVQLALKCGDEDLIQSAFDYCGINFRHIIRSVEWQRYITEHPIEANEILIKSCGPP